ncbi:MAG: DUF401 family protein [Promethearchaeota archaeon]
MEIIQKMIIIPSWVYFLIVLILIMMVSSKLDLGLSLILGALLFGLFTGVDLIQSIGKVLLRINNHVIALAVFLIPILGGLMQDSGLMANLLKNLRLSKKLSLILSPSIFGLLPIAGGALLSAPVVDEIDPELSKAKKVVINVWYRHVLIILYPLSASVIISVAAAGIPLYNGVLYLIFPCVIMVIVGYFTLVSNVSKFEELYERNIRKALIYMAPILIAPIIDIIGRNLTDFAVPELFMLSGLIISIFLAIYLSRIYNEYDTENIDDKEREANNKGQGDNESGANKNKVDPVVPVDINSRKIKELKYGDIGSIIKKMKAWRYPLLIYGIKLFIDVFNNSGAAEEIALMSSSFLFFLVIGFFLGYATGRVEVPAPILFSIYLAKTMLISMPIYSFILIYFAIFLGYVATPIHPCVAYSLKYFDIKYAKIIKTMFIPTLISFGILLILYVFGLLMGYPY